MLPTRMAAAAMAVGLETKSQLHTEYVAVFDVAAIRPFSLLNTVLRLEHRLLCPAVAQSQADPPDVLRQQVAEEGAERRLANDGHSLSGMDAAEPDAAVTEPQFETLKKPAGLKARSPMLRFTGERKPS